MESINQIGLKYTCILLKRIIEWCDMTLTPDLQASFKVTAYPLVIGTMWGEVWVRFEQREKRYARDKDIHIIKYTQNHHTSLYPKIVFTIVDNTVCPVFFAVIYFPPFFAIILNSQRIKHAKIMSFIMY